MTSRRMRFVFFISALIPVVQIPRAEAQSLTVQEWVDQFVASCVGSGSTDVTSGQVDANGDISLKRLAVGGALKGQVQIERRSVRLLSDGINNSMSAATAEVASEVRKCLAPVRSILMQIMQSQFQSSMHTASRIYILSPQEDLVIKTLSNMKGYFGKAGNAVIIDKLQSETGLGDIRFRSAMRMLREKFYVFEGINFGQGSGVSLTSDGEEYALNVGFAK